METNTYILPVLKTVEGYIVPKYLPYLSHSWTWLESYPGDLAKVVAEVEWWQHRMLVNNDDVCFLPDGRCKCTCTKSCVRVKNEQC